VENAGNGKYKIYCWTSQSGKRFMEAFPKDDYVRPSVEDVIQDQLWDIIPLGKGFHRVSCNTKNRGQKSMEAFPRDDVMRMRDISDDQDQNFEFIPW
jgi:hypothetical protein